MPTRLSQNGEGIVTISNYTGVDLAEKTAANREGDETIARADARDTCMIGLGRM